MSTSIQSNQSDSVLLVNGVSAVPFNAGGTVYKIQSVYASVAANALTVGLNPCILHFRNLSAVNGAPSLSYVNSAISLTVPTGATLGTINAISARLILIAIDVSGVVELAITNISGGISLDETGFISTTAISAAATANNIIYSTIARTNVPYRVVGFVDITEATAGTWATAPTLIQGSGGQALTAMGSLGYGQTFKAVTRTSGVTYYSGERPIFLLILCNLGSSATSLTVGGVSSTIAGNGTPNANLTATGVTIPPNTSYVITDSGTNTHLTRELS